MTDFFVSEQLLMSIVCQLSINILHSLKNVGRILMEKDLCFFNSGHRKR